MKQKVIICGAGRVGTSITEHLSNEGFDIIFNQFINLNCKIFC